MIQFLIVLSEVSSPKEIYCKRKIFWLKIDRMAGLKIIHFTAFCRPSKHMNWMTWKKKTFKNILFVFGRIYSTVFFTQPLVLGTLVAQVVTKFRKMWWKKLLKVLAPNNRDVSN